MAEPEAAEVFRAMGRRYISEAAILDASERNPESGGASKRS
jgi:hypothetical protein